MAPLVYRVAGRVRCASAATSANSTNSIRMFLLTWSSWRAICSLCVSPDAHATTPRQMERTLNTTTRPNVKAATSRTHTRSIPNSCIRSVYTVDLAKDGVSILLTQWSTRSAFYYKRSLQASTI